MTNANKEDIEKFAVLNEARVAICVPSGDMIHARFAFSLITLCHAVHGRIKTRVTNAIGSRITLNRNRLVEEALENGCTHILFLDSDMVFPPSILERLLAYDLPIVGTVYTKRERGGVVVGLHAELEGISPVPKFREYFFTGLGCILIKREVFERMEKPWFREVCYEGQAVSSGEDIYFCGKARELGYKIIVDEDASLAIGHIGSEVFYIPYNEGENAD